VKLNVSDPWVFEIGQVIVMHETPGFFWVKSVSGYEVELSSSRLGRYWCIFRVWLREIAV
jgi:hypothetical protein